MKVKFFKRVFIILVCFAATVGFLSCSDDQTVNPDLSDLIVEDSIDTEIVDSLDSQTELDEVEQTDTNIQDSLTTVLDSTDVNETEEDTVLDTTDVEDTDSDTTQIEDTVIEDTVIEDTVIDDTGVCGGFYSWPVYSPNIEYDYVDEFGEIPMPTRGADDVTGVAGEYVDRWWIFKWGANKNSLVTENAWIPMLERFNQDFDFITNEMRWPRDGRARDGYYSAVYLYGSGLSTDNASNTALGGWQSRAGRHPIVLASYYPVYSFDPSCTYNDRNFQMGAMIHEGIHCILASMPGCRNAAWFHEGGNTWLQATMEARQAGGIPTSMGWLSAGAAIAPFMPIETYSGWLQDGSFGGPSAERVNMHEGGQQICTWRRLLGGTQYGETFAHGMATILGDKSIAWVWRYASESGRVLQDIAEVSGGLGPHQTRRLITEYRARQVFGDFGMWRDAYLKLLNDNWNRAIGAEWEPSWMPVDVWNSTCYVSTQRSGNRLTPQERTLPGWSGANQIPLEIEEGATCASVNFNPGSSNNMTLQLVYQNSNGTIRYGTPVTEGVATIPLEDVKNNVIIAVVANTDYIYDGGVNKYSYTLDIESGISQAADIFGRWYR